MSKLRCWQGCLAYTTHPADFGRMVEVIARAPSGRYFFPDGSYSVCRDRPHHWVIRPAGGGLMPITGPSGLVEKHAAFGICSDEWLRPITPPPSADTETVADVLDLARRHPAEV